MKRSKKTATPQPPQKNPARVAAAKRTAANRIRIDGKFVSKVFIQEYIQPIAELSGIDISNREQVRRFAEQNADSFKDIWELGGVQSPNEKADTTVFKELNEFSNRGGHLLLNGEESDTNTIKFKMLQVEQFLFSNTNAAGVAFKPFVYFKGKQEVRLPTLRELEELVEEMEETELAEYLNENYGVKVWMSPKQRRNVSREENKRRNAKIERKAKAVSKSLKDAKAKIRTKGRRN